MILENFTIKSNAENLKPIRKKVETLLKQMAFSEKVRKNILVAFGEGCTNAIRHAYRGEPGHEIHVTVREEEKKVVIKIRDFGQKIDLTKIKTPELPPDKPGGLGIYFMQTIMDQIEYNTSHDRGNELILTKYKEDQSKE